MYKSPIEIIQSDIETNIENNVYEAVQKMHIDVNKDELIKALRYDRYQYEAGYNDAINDTSVHAHWIKEENGNEKYCSNCGEPIYQICENAHYCSDYCGENYKPKYCANCGAKMDEEEN